MFKFSAFVFFMVLTVSFSALGLLPKNRLEFISGTSLEDYDCPDGQEAQKVMIRNASGQDRPWVVCQTKTTTLPSDVEDLSTRPFKKTIWHKSELNSMQRDLLVLTFGLSLLAVAFAISLSSALGLMLGYFLTLILSSAYGFNQDYLGYVGVLLFLILLIFSKAFQMILSRITIIQKAEEWIKSKKEEEKSESHDSEPNPSTESLPPSVLVVNHIHNGGSPTATAEPAKGKEDKKSEEKKEDEKKTEEKHDDHHAAAGAAH